MELDSSPPAEQPGDSQLDASSLLSGLTSQVERNQSQAYTKRFHDCFHTYQLPTMTAYTYRELCQRSNTSKLPAFLKTATGHVVPSEALVHEYLENMVEIGDHYSTVFAAAGLTAHDTKRGRNLLVRCAFEEAWPCFMQYMELPAKKQSFCHSFHRLEECGVSSRKVLEMLKSEDGTLFISLDILLSGTTTTLCKLAIDPSVKGMWNRVKPQKPREPATKSSYTSNCSQCGGELAHGTRHSYEICPEDQSL